MVTEPQENIDASAEKEDSNGQKGGLQWDLTERIAKLFRVESGATEKTDETGATEKTDEIIYDWDLVLLFRNFNCNANSDDNNSSEFTSEKLLGDLLGLRTVLVQDVEEELVDTSKQILKTARCFVDENGRMPRKLQALSSQLLDAVESTERIYVERQRVEEMKCLLREEYKRFVGSDNPTTAQVYNKLVCHILVSRLQLACGLTVKSKYSVDNDEIICVVRADDADLMTEAERSSYCLQLNNEPFNKRTLGNPAVSEHRDGTVGYPEDYEAPLQSLLRLACDRAENPVLDPGIEQRQPILQAFLKSVGHSEDHNTGSAAVSGVYLAPYAPFLMDPFYMPLYRKFHNCGRGDTCYSPFRAVDRCRLTSSIIERHLNLKALTHSRLLKEQFFLHSPQELQLLRESWFNSGDFKQPLAQIRNYFGEKIAMYFAWLEHFRNSLVIPSITGLLLYCIRAASLGLTERKSNIINASYACFIAIWSIFQAQTWRRQMALLNLWWGTSEGQVGNDLRTQRPAFEGIVAYSELDDTREMKRRGTNQLYKQGVISCAIILCCVCLVAVGVYCNLRLKTYLVAQKVVAAPVFSASALNALQISIGNWIFTQILTRLNDFENYRTQQSYENALIKKLYFVMFWNSFGSFFYIAFARKGIEGSCQRLSDGSSLTCIQELEWQLMAVFVVNFVLGNAQELLQPVIIAFWRKSKEGSMSEGQIQHSPIELETKLERYEEDDAFVDYAELVVRFGYVTLFVVAFPIAPLCALVANAIELRVDSLKLCTSYKRPYPHKGSGIGLWSDMLGLISVVSIITNTALIIFSMGLFDAPPVQLKLYNKWALFIVAEHAALVLKQMIESLLQEESECVSQLVHRYEWIRVKIFEERMEDPATSKVNQDAETTNMSIHSHLVSFGSLRHKALSKPPPILSAPAVPKSYEFMDRVILKC